MPTRDREHAKLSCGTVTATPLTECWQYASSVSDLTGLAGGILPTRRKQRRWYQDQAGGWHEYSENQNQVGGPRQTTTCDALP